MTDQAYFRREGDHFLPLPSTRGFWGADTIHGPAVVGLVGHEIERRHGGEGLVPARFSIDMHRLARQRPVEIVSSVVRDGRRLRLVEARFLVDGEEHARAQCQFLRATDHPEGRVWPGLAPWDVPLPAELPPVPGDGQGIAEWRLVAGQIGHYGPRQLWARQLGAMVAGEPLTPFTRVAALADMANPWIHAAETGVVFINSDVVVQLHRLPTTEWTGIESVVHDGSQGIATGFARLYDEAGSIGFVSATAIANSRR